MYNSGFRTNKKTPDGVGTVAAQAAFVQLSDPAPAILSWSIQGSDDRALDPAGGQTVVVKGAGFTSGMTVTVGTSSIGAVTIVNSSQATFTAPAKAAGNYTLTMANSNGQAAILVPGLAYSTLVTWTTPAGSIGDTVETTAFTESVVATADSSITYSLASGSLPTGATLNANGTITGTAVSTDSPTTYSFSIVATDEELQDSTQSFTITVNPDSVTWVSPAAGASISLLGNQAMSNVTLSATAASGSGITYAANALPTGVSLTGNVIYGTPTVAETVSTLLTATANTTARYSTETITWVVTIGDIYWPSVSLLLNGETPTTTFINDASLNNNQLTIAGDTKPNNFNPYSGGYYSNYFDGTGDYLSIATNALFAFSTGSLTVEAWINTTVKTNYQNIIGSYDDSTKAWFLHTASTGVVLAGLNASTYITGTINVCDGRWHHIAMVRNGASAFTLYIDGVADGTLSDSTDINTGVEVRIGSLSTGATRYFTGNISNVRVVKGSALYTSAFTPSTTPLTTTSQSATASQVSLLTCQSPRLIDNSNNNLTITKNGDTTVSPAYPFVTPTTSSYNTQYSTYFPGASTSYIESVDASAFNFGTGDFTAEAWAISLDNSIAECIFNIRSSAYGLMLRIDNPNTNWELYYSGASSKVVAQSTYGAATSWTHHAITRQSGVLKWWINGVLAFTNNGNTEDKAYTTITIGKYSSYGWLGNISNVRVVKGLAVYTGTFTPPTSPLQATQSAGTNISAITAGQTTFLSCQSNIVKDNSSYALTVNSYASAQPIAQSPFTMTTSTNTLTSLGSHYFSATSAYSTVSMGGTQAFGTGDFTVECWLYMAGTTAVNISMAATATTTWELLTYANQLYWHENGGNLGGAGYGTVPTNAWVHLAVSRKSSVLKMFVNGVQVYSAANIYNYSNNTTVRSIGPYNGGASPFYVNDFRVINGTGLYTANFLPPQAPLTPVDNTQLLTCQYNGGANNNGVVDQSSFNNIITRAGNTTQGTFSPYSQTGWGTYFNGANTDYLTWPTAGNATIGKVAGTKVTYEFWYYQTTTQAITAWVSGMLGSMPAVSASGRWFIALVGTSATSPVTVRYAWTTSTSTLDNVTTTATLAQNQWNHVAVCIDATTASNTTITIYLNGVGQTFTGKNLSDQSNTYGSAEYIGWNGDVQSFSGYISNLRVVRGQTVYTGNFTPPTSPLNYSQPAGTNISAVTPEQTVLLTCQNNRFVDNSQYNYAITVASGSPRTQAYSPFGGVTSVPTSYSNYFDGTGDYLSAATNTAFNFSTGDFTVEAWVYPNSLSTDWFIVTASGAGGFFIGFSSSSTIGFGWGRAGIAWDYRVAGSATVNTWQHVAVTRSGTSMRLFVNGIQQGTTQTISTAYDMSTTSTTIGSQGANYYLNGFISNLRVVKGTALYTTNFTPSATPLTTTSQGATASEVSLLTCQSNTIIDNSPNYFTLTANGNTATRPFNPFGTTNTSVVSYTPSVNGGSMYFDGTGDYLTVNGTTSATLPGDFTVEFWGYPLDSNTSEWVSKESGFQLYTISSAWSIALSASNNSTYFWNVSATATPLNAWAHVAVTRSGNNYYLFVNGVQQQTLSSASTPSLGTTYPWTIGAYSANTAQYPVNGYISDLRMTNGKALYTSNFYPGPAPATPTTTIGTTTYASNLLLNGTSGGIIDWHSTNDLETVGNTQLAPQDPYAGNYYSNQLVNASDVWKITGAGTPLQLTGDFTVEFWIFPTNTTVSYMQVLNSSGGNGNALKLAFSSGNAYFYFYNGTSYTYSSAVVTGKWQHVVWERSGITSRMYINGVGQTAVTTMTATVDWSTLYWGAGNGSEQFFGYMSNLRIIKDQCLYDITQSTLTVPTTPLTAVAGTSLLTCQSNTFKDNSSNNFTITKTGSTSVKSINPFQNNTGKSLYFDGTGDSSKIPDNPNINLGAGSFTLECWVYFNAVNAEMIIINKGWQSSSAYASYLIYMTSSGSLRFLASSNGSSWDIANEKVIGTMTAGKWIYIAVTRSDTTFRAYVDGVINDAFTFTNSSALANIPAQALFIGGRTDNNSSLNGYIKDLRITKGVARYTTTFTPPTTPDQTK